MLFAAGFGTRMGALAFTLWSLAKVFVPERVRLRTQLLSARDRKAAARVMAAVPPRVLPAYLGGELATGLDGGCCQAVYHRRLSALHGVRDSVLNRFRHVFLVF